MLPNIIYGTAVLEDSRTDGALDPRTVAGGPLDPSTVSLSLLDLSTAAGCT